MKHKTYRFQFIFANAILDHSTIIQVVEAPVWVYTVNHIFDPEIYIGKTEDKEGNNSFILYSIKWCNSLKI